jgi:hypothetical protein
MISLHRNTLFVAQLSNQQISNPTTPQTPHHPNKQQKMIKIFRIFPKHAEVAKKKENN